MDPRGNIYAHIHTTEEITILSTDIQPTGLPLPSRGE